MTDERALLAEAADRAATYLEGLATRRVAPDQAALDALAAFAEPFPEQGASVDETLAMLDRVGSPGTMASAGDRYFGFVNGATYPVALAAGMLASVWDQNAALPVMSPTAAAVHDTAASWLRSVFALPDATDVTFVSGATVANACGLAAARDALLLARGWDAQRDGLFGAPAIPVVIGEGAHSTLRKSLGLVGLGRERVIVVPADDQGAMRADLLPDLDGPVVVCAQAGEVNTGAFDPFDQLASWTTARDGWLHVDGAFGLWALADRSRAALVAGLTRADSLATDAHKWLNVTYDSGIVCCTRPGALRRTFAAGAGYLPPDTGFEAMHHTPASSQRARQIEVWAVLRTLGRAGVAELVRSCCDAARTIADVLADAGFTVLNDVVLNQVLVRYGDPSTTTALVEAVQADGATWCGPTQWQGEPAMRISVSSWRTTDESARASADAIVRCARSIGRRGRRGDRFASRTLDDPQGDAPT